MSIQLNLEVPDVNTVLEGLARVADNSARVQDIVRQQAGAQLAEQQKAAEEAAKAAQAAAGDGGQAQA